MREDQLILADVEFDPVFKRVASGLTDPERAAGLAVTQAFEELPPAVKAKTCNKGRNSDDTKDVSHRRRLPFILFPPLADCGCRSNFAGLASTSLCGFC